MKIKPRNNLVLVELIKQDARTPGGVFVPQSVQIGPNIGRITDLGPDASTEKNPLAIGDRVLIQQGYAPVMHLDGKEHILLEADRIPAKIEEV